jgi:hypothetical protein
MANQMNDKDQKQNSSVNIVSQNDIMIKILETKGKQESETDYSFVLDEGVLKYQNKI